MYKSRRFTQQMMRREKQKVQPLPKFAVGTTNPFLLEVSLIKKQPIKTIKNQTKGKNPCQKQMVSIPMTSYCHTHPKIQNTHFEFNCSRISAFWLSSPDKTTTHCLIFISWVSREYIIFRIICITYKLGFLCRCGHQSLILPGTLSIVATFLESQQWSVIEYCRHLYPNT